MATQRIGGLKIPHPTFVSIDPQVLTLPSISSLHPYHPGLGYLYDISGSANTWIAMDNRFHINEIVSRDKNSNLVSLRLHEKAKDSLVDCSGFLKITHLLDPITWIRGKYDLDPESSKFFDQALPTGKASEKLNDPMNQAYVEAVATYCLSKLREADVSPHFHYFYGAYRGVADQYAYNISDVFSSYRHCRWFWNNQESGIFEVGVDQPMDEELAELIFEPPSELHSEVDSEETRSTEELEDENEEDAQKVELQSLHSTSMSSVGFKSESEDSVNSEDEDEGEEGDDENDALDELNILANISNFPVMALFTEPSEGTMDSLLTGWEGCMPGDKLWEPTWTAWLFQILAALSVLQTFFGFTHNDLHTNNIVWAKTDVKYFFYTNRDGTVWRVPTFGKVFRLIDFGRAIFSVNTKLFYSDDFKPGNDAAEQFSFGPLRDESTDDPEVYPNPSFDLSRLAVSLFEALFPVRPEAKKNGSLLSHEPGLKVKETISDLHNLIWSWMIDEDGRNVLMDADGRERYPDFDLYKVITQKVHEAVPKEQILRPMFDSYRIGKGKVPKAARVYNLFF